MVTGDIVQIANVVNDAEAAAERYCNDFEIGPWELITLEPPQLTDSFVRGVRQDFSARLAVAWHFDTQVVLIQPLEGQSIYHEFLHKVPCGGCHHIQLLYPDCESMVKRYSNKGFSVIQSGRIGSYRYYHLDTREAMGVCYSIANSVWMETRHTTSNDSIWPFAFPCFASRRESRETTNIECVVDGRCLTAGHSPG